MSEIKPFSIDGETKEIKRDRLAMAIKPVVDVRAEPKFKSERVHQIVFGEIVELLEEQIDNEYLYICDKRLDYRGYVNRNTLHILSEDEHSQISKLPFLKVSVPFCRTIGGLSFILPVGSILYEQSENEYIMPNGTVYSLVDSPLSAHDNIIDLALDFLGVPYLWGGTSSYGFDCSGFVNRIYDLIGKWLPRDAGDQEEYLESVEFPEPGDLLFMKGHVMMYLGERKIVHANGHDMCVSITDLNKDDYGKYLKSQIRKIGRLC